MGLGVKKLFHAQVGVGYQPIVVFFKGFPGGHQDTRVLTQSHFFMTLRSALLVFGLELQIQSMREWSPDDSPNGFKTPLEELGKGSACLLAFCFLGVSRNVIFRSVRSSEGWSVVDRVLWAFDPNYEGSPSEAKHSESLKKKTSRHHQPRPSAFPT